MFKKLPTYIGLAAGCSIGLLAIYMPLAIIFNGIFGSGCLL